MAAILFLWSENWTSYRMIWPFENWTHSSGFRMFLVFRSGNRMVKTRWQPFFFYFLWFEYWTKNRMASYNHLKIESQFFVKWNVSGIWMSGFLMVTVYHKSWQQFLSCLVSYLYSSSFISSNFQPASAIVIAQALNNANDPATPIVQMTQLKLDFKIGQVIKRDRTWGTVSCATHFSYSEHPKTGHSNNWTIRSGFLMFRLA
jgi:hypothetical protein